MGCTKLGRRLGRIQYLQGNEIDLKDGREPSILEKDSKMEGGES